MNAPAPRGSMPDPDGPKGQFDDDELAPGAGSLFQYEAHGIAIELFNVSKWYQDLVAISDVSCRIGFGVTALLGPNGAGKSTLFRMLCGLTAPSRGRIAVLGSDPRENLAMTTAIGLVPQQEGVFEALSAPDFVELAGVLHGVPNPRRAARDALAAVELDPNDTRLLTSYSKGMRQRVKVAQALVHDPKVLFLDEPLNGLDPRQRLHLVELIQQLGEDGRCVVVSSHVLEEVERFSDRVLVIVKGRLAAQGDFRRIRELMDDQPHRFSIRCSDGRVMGTALMAHANTEGMELIDDHTVVVETKDVALFRHVVAAVAAKYGVRIHDLTTVDDDLDSVFRYLVGP